MRRLLFLYLISLTLATVSAAESRTCPCWYFVPNPIEVTTKLGDIQKKTAMATNVVLAGVQVAASVPAGPAAIAGVIAYNGVTTPAFVAGASMTMMSAEGSHERLKRLAPLTRVPGIRSVSLIKTALLSFDGTTPVETHSRAYAVLQTARPILESEGAAPKDLRRIRNSWNPELGEPFAIDPKEAEIELTLQREGHMIPDLDAPWRMKLEKLLNKERMPLEVTEAWINAYENAVQKTREETTAFWKKATMGVKKPTPEGFSVNGKLFNDGREVDLGPLAEGGKVKGLLGLDLITQLDHQINKSHADGRGGTIRTETLNRATLRTCRVLFGTFGVK